MDVDLLKLRYFVATPARSTSGHSGHSDRTIRTGNSTASPSASTSNATVSTTHQPERRRLVITTVPVRTQLDKVATSL